MAAQRFPWAYKTKDGNVSISDGTSTDLFDMLSLLVFLAVILFLPEVEKLLLLLFLQLY